MEDLRRHLLCLERATGKTLWPRNSSRSSPSTSTPGKVRTNGYAASTPVIEGETPFNVFLGKSGVYCFDLDGKEIWHSLVGKNTDGWGSGASPMLYKDTLIVNASVESGALVALTRTPARKFGVRPASGAPWNTPVLVTTPEKTQELVVSVQDRVVGIDPDTGKELWARRGRASLRLPQRRRTRRHCLCQWRREHVSGGQGRRQRGRDPVAWHLAR